MIEASFTVLNFAHQGIIALEIIGKEM